VCGGGGGGEGGAIGKERGDSTWLEWMKTDQGVKNLRQK